MDDEQNASEQVDDLLTELHILIVTMELATRMQDAGLRKREALIACRALTFILEEFPDSVAPEKRRAKADIVAPALREFVMREIQQLHDRKPQR